MMFYLKYSLGHGCANHATEGETLHSPIHCCDVTNLPTCSVANYELRPYTVNACLCTPCAVRGRSVLLCAQYT